MRLSEAMELGHTLIGEDHTLYLSIHMKCGCALGSVAAASYDTLREATKNLMFTDDLFKKYPALEKYINLEGEKSTVILYYHISTTHAHGMPRLEIAKKLRVLEDKGLIPWIEDTPREKEVTQNEQTKIA